MIAASVRQRYGLAMRGYGKPRHHTRRTVKDDLSQRRMIERYAPSSGMWSAVDDVPR